MKTHFDVLLGDLVRHAHDPEDITGLANLLRGFQGAVDASSGTLGSPVTPPVITVSGWWLISKQGYVSLGGVSTLFEAGDMLLYTLSTTTYSRIDAKVNDAQVDITSTFTKLLTGLATQKTVNEKVDKLITVTTTAPLVTSDGVNGYFVGCLWLNTATSKVYLCKDITTGAAVWIDLTLTGSETATPYRDFTDQTSDPAVPSAGVHRMFTDSAGVVYLQDSAGAKLFLSPGTKINHIGIAGQLGYGVGICPPDLLAVYNAANSGKEIRSMNGTFDINSSNYGNYYVTHDSSVIVWIPYFWAKIGTDNIATTKPGGDYADEATANAAGYFLPRGFVNGGLIKRGLFLDKYSASLTGITAAVLDASGSLAGNGIFSSIKNGNPLSSDGGMIRKLVTAADNLYAGSFANCRANSQSPVDAYYGGIDAVKSRGSQYHVWTVFERQILWILSKAHQVAAVGTNYCAWNGVSPYAPKGNNNYGADYNDAALTFTACNDAYWGARNEARKAGSGSVFAKTTNNGQNSGICDINGNLYMFLMGLTCIAESAQAIVSIDRAAECTITVTNAAASKSNYANNRPVLITGSLTGEWATLLKDRLFTISDLSGNTFKIKNQTGAYVDTSTLTADYVSGLNTTTGKFYVLKESIDVKDITSGVSGATDHWGATGVAAMFDEVFPDFCGSYVQYLGSGSNQVFSGETNRTLDAYKLSAALLCKDKNGSGAGTTAMGNDYYIPYIIDNMAPLAFYTWGNDSDAGVGASHLDNNRPGAGRYVSVRAGLYLL